MKFIKNILIGSLIVWKTKIRNPHKYNFSIIYFIFHYLLCIYITRKIKVFKKVPNYNLKSLISKKSKIQKVEIMFKLPIKEKYKLIKFN